MKLPQRWLVPGLVIVFAIQFSGCATDAANKKRRAEAARDMGERYLSAGQPGKALQQFLKALEDNPDDPYLHYDLAWTYDLKKAPGKTEFHLKEAIRLKPDYSDAHNYLGVIYFRNGRVDQAIEAYKEALSNLLYLNPQDAHLNLGVAYLSRKEYGKAATHLETAVSLVPDFAIAYNNLGEAYEGLRRNREARRAYEKALEFDPDYVDAHLNLGKLLYRSGERKKAAESFTEVVRLSPQSESAMEARRYLSRGR